jgi:hypothetical protein
MAIERDDGVAVDADEPQDQPAARIAELEGGVHDTSANAASITGADIGL